MGGRRCEGYGVCSDAAQQHFALGKMLGGRRRSLDCAVFLFAGEKLKLIKWGLTKEHPCYILTTVSRS